MLEMFDHYTSLGLKVIPLHEGSKRPLFRDWTTWDRQHSRRIVRQRGEVNLGLLLGDIMDVEGDSLEANNRIQKLIGDYPHPCYRSNKSTHHLFASPLPDLGIIKQNDIEFRGVGHQSVLPPSRMTDGTVYSWITPFEGHMPPMPERLWQLLEQMLGRRKRQRIKPGHMRVYCGQCRREVILHAKRFQAELGVSKQAGGLWVCQRCRPCDLRAAVRSWRRFCASPA